MRLAWAGPLALAGYFLWQYTGTLVGAPAAMAWLALTAIALTVAITIVRRRWHRSLTPAEWMAVEVLVASGMTDVGNSLGGGLRDLHVYLHAGAHFVAGAAVYTTVPLHAYPSDLGDLPFLYPPPTLPLFGLLAALPTPLAEGAWLAASLGALLLALRAFGLSWRWTALVLLWPPVEQGLFVGNVVVPGLLLLGLAPRVGAGLILGPLLKPQNGIVALWLVREQAWRSLVAGVLALAVVVLVTLPLTGVERWSEWVAGLFAYQDSQRFLAGLYGVGLARWLPFGIFVAAAIGVTVAALLAGGRAGLARLSVASLVASPSLWSHGFLFAIPAFLRLRAQWLWFAAGLLCVGSMPGPQVALAIPIVGWWAVRLNRDATEAGLAGPHPLGATIEPWPSDAEAGDALQPAARGLRGDAGASPIR